MVRTVLGFMALIATLYVGICAFLYVFQRSLIYFPQPRALPATQYACALHTPDADLILTVYESAGPDAVIYFGGNAEDVSLSLPELRAAFPDKAMYLLHYRAYGGSSGKPSEAALHRDASALYEKASAKHARITVIGRSLGSGVAIRLAAAHPVQGLILITPYYSLADLAAKQFPYIPVRWLLRDKFESWRDAPRIAAPTTIIVAEHDEVIPEEAARDLYSAFHPGVADYVLIRGANHNDISDSPDYIRALQFSPAGDVHGPS
jgi:uncharacterized protein